MAANLTSSLFATVDRVGNTLSPVNSLIVKTMERFLPQVAAKAGICGDNTVACYFYCADTFACYIQGGQRERRVKYAESQYYCDTQRYLGDCSYGCVQPYNC